MYDFLMEEIDQPTDFFEMPDTVMHIDVIGSGSEEDINLYLRYYADEEFREDWRARFPDFEVPPREPAPFDRDRFLPKREDLFR